MPTRTYTGAPAGSVSDGADGQQRRARLRRTLLTLLAIYLLPFLLLTIYFHLRTLALRERSLRAQLVSVAEYQAHMLDLFIRERAVNLANKVDLPLAEATPSRATLQSYLDALKRDSETFVDVGVFDERGVQVGYAGPYSVLEQRDYGAEPWFRQLRRQPDGFVITDMYLGFRQRPHFTIAVRREVDDRFFALRATLDPDGIYDFITGLEGARELRTTIVSREGTYQFVSPDWGGPLAESAIVPPREPAIDVVEVTAGGEELLLGYAWLVEADWALLTQSAGPGPNVWLLGGDIYLAFLALVIVLVILAASVASARKSVRIEQERDETRVQLEHAAKLASVGELASGIAHEINNPLAIISEEAGLIKDLMDPRFAQNSTFDDLRPHLDTIHTAVFRCRDITRKLLGFVRKTEFRLARHELTQVMDEVADDYFVQRMELENIRVVREYTPDLPAILTDKNQLQQVLLNIVNNAADAIVDSGRITIRIDGNDDEQRVAVTDDGVGMTPEQLERIFMPFYTTKEVGKGTGLGLSVSYGIVESLGGRIEVASAPGRGSTFTIVLPVR